MERTGRIGGRGKSGWDVIYEKRIGTHTEKKTRLKNRNTALSLPVQISNTHLQFLKTLKKDFKLSVARGRFQMHA